MTSHQKHVLVMDCKGRPCKRDHSQSFNLLIKGTKKRYCTYIMVGIEREDNGRFTVLQCGDVPL